MNKVTVSVIIVTWNSEEHLPCCRNSLTNYTFNGFEVILIDNESTDGSISDLEQDWTDLSPCVERLPDNQGFAVMNNFCACLGRGPWLALLNVCVNLVRKGAPIYPAFCERPER